MKLRTAVLLALAAAFFLTAGCRYPYEAYRDPYTGRVYYVPASYPTYTPPAPHSVSGTVTYSQTRVNPDYYYCTTCGSYYPSSYGYSGCPYCRSYYQTYGAVAVTPVRTYTTHTYYPSTYRTYYHAPKPHAHHPRRRSPPPPTRKPPTYTRKTTTLKIPVPKIPIPKIKLPGNPASKILDLIKKK